MPTPPRHLVVLGAALLAAVVGCRGSGDAAAPPAPADATRAGDAAARTAPPPAPVSVPAAVPSTDPEIAALIARLRTARRVQLATEVGPAEQRPAVVEHLIRRGPAVVPAVRPELTSAQADTRYFAVQVLGAVGTSLLVEPLIERLGDPDPGVVSAAAEALGRLRDERTVPLVFRALEDGRVAQVRWGLLVRPVRAADLELVPFLVDRLSAGQTTSRLSAALLLEQLTGHPVGLDPGAPAEDRTRAIVSWEAWWQRNAAATRDRLARSAPPGGAP